MTAVAFLKCWPDWALRCQCLEKPSTLYYPRGGSVIETYTNPYLRQNLVVLFYRKTDPYNKPVLTFNFATFVTTNASVMKKKKPTTEEEATEDITVFVERFVSRETEHTKREMLIVHREDEWPHTALGLVSPDPDVMQSVNRFARGECSTVSVNDLTWMGRKSIVVVYQHVRVRFYSPLQEKATYERFREMSLVEELSPEFAKMFREESSTEWPLVYTPMTAEIEKIRELPRYNTEEEHTHAADNAVFRGPLSSLSPTELTFWDTPTAA